MKHIRCLIGVHAWSNALPTGVATQHGAVTLACQRCGRVVRRSGYRPPPDPPDPPPAVGGGDGIGAW